MQYRQGRATCLAQQQSTGPKSLWAGFYVGNIAVQTFVSAVRRIRVALAVDFVQDALIQTGILLKLKGSYHGLSLFTACSPYPSYNA